MFGIFQNKVDVFKRSSSSIIKVFTDTVDQLKTVNDSISDEISSKEEVVKQMGIDVSTMNALKASNDKIINNIEQILL